jgi:uncharacterized membrane protein required for colicin V production
MFSLIAGLILFFSFIGGAIEGGVRSFFALISLVIAIPIAGRFYTNLAGPFDSLGKNWGNFIAFFIVLALVIVALQFVFFYPRRFLDMFWGTGIISRFVGAILNALNAAVGLVVFTYVISAFPVWGWLQQELVNSGVFSWLVSSMGFVSHLLPQVIGNSL